MTKKQAKFVATGVPRNKQAAVNMRREEHQFVIDGYLVDEVLSQIPDNIKILGAKVSAHQVGVRQKIMVPNALKKCGVAYMSQRGSSKEAYFIFDSTNATIIRRYVKEGCAKLDLRYDRAYFSYILVTNGKGNVMFRHCTKEIKPDETDLRKKLRVLGATEGEGQVQSVVADLNAKKYKCVIKEEPMKFVMCYKE